jgi:pre-rRNA-processing protein TSR2
MSALVQPPLRCTQEQMSWFVKGVEAVLQQWTALLLVQNHVAELTSNFRNGELNPMVELRFSLLSWFERDGEVYADELEDYLEEFFENDVRCVRVEDGSIKEVSVALHNMYCQCAKNDPSVAQQYVVSLARYNGVALSCSDGTAGGENATGVDVDGDDEDDGSADSDVAPSSRPLDLNAVAVPFAPAAMGPAAAAPPTPAAPSKSSQKKNRSKNPYTRDADGWCTVTRKR